MQRKLLGVGTVFVVACLVVLASSGAGTVASFGDSEQINATFAATAAQPQPAGLTVTVRNGQQQDSWADGMSAGPPGYQTNVIVVTGADGELRMSIDSNATEPLQFAVDADLVRDALGVSDLRGVTATLDGQPLSISIRGSGANERVVFTIDHFSTRYVVFTAPAPTPSAPAPTAPAGPSGPSSPSGPNHQPPQAGGPHTDSTTPTTGSGQ